MRPSDPPPIPDVPTPLPILNAFRPAVPGFPKRRPERAAAFRKDRGCTGCIRSIAGSGRRQVRSWSFRGLFSRSPFLVLLALHFELYISSFCCRVINFIFVVAAVYRALKSSSRAPPPNLSVPSFRRNDTSVATVARSFMNSSHLPPERCCCFIRG